MKKAYLFAGQGQQFLNMGKDLAQHFPHINQIYQQASAIAGFDVLNLTQEQLDQTEYTQPALLTLNHAIASLLDTSELIDYTAGLSLGEYSALVFAGVLSFEDALNIVLKRAKIMANALQDTGMVALVKTDLESVESAIESLDVAICNHNTPSQIVIGGYLKDLEIALPVLKEKGIKRAIPLKVSSVSHMYLMEDASKALEAVLKTVNFNEPKTNFINNIHAQVQTNDFVDSLSKQISHRTRLSETIQKMLENGVREFIEIGPKGSLAKCVLAHDDTLTVRSIYDLETYQKETQTNES